MRVFWRWNIRFSCANIDWMTRENLTSLHLSARFGRRFGQRTVHCCYTGQKDWMMLAKWVMMEPWSDSNTYKRQFSSDLRKHSRCYRYQCLTSFSSCQFYLDIEGSGRNKPLILYIWQTQITSPPVTYHVSANKIHVQFALLASKQTDSFQSWR